MGKVHRLALGRVEPSCFLKDGGRRSDGGPDQRRENPALGNIRGHGGISAQGAQGLPSRGGAEQIFNDGQKARGVVPCA